MWHRIIVLGSVLGALTLVRPSWSAAPVTLESPSILFRIEPDTGSYQIHDKSSGVIWQSNPFEARFGEATYRQGDNRRRLELGPCSVIPSPTRLDLLFRPRPDQPESIVRVSVQLSLERNALEFCYTTPEERPVESLRLLDQALWTSDGEEGSVIVPVREGLQIPADTGKAFTHRFDTFAYEGCHMQMLGLLKRGSAVLVTWSDPYTAVDLQSVLTNAVWVPGRQILAPSLVLSKSARSCRIQFLGRGDAVSIGKAYRPVAADQGWLTPWQTKRQSHPERAQLFGAINFKLWSVLDREMNEESTREVRTRLNWTFAEAAEVAEHLKKDLRLDRVLFTVGGWIRRGYDNQHPDVLPAAPECGGNPGLADCARRVQALGYLFCLHDNYQDIYRDSPSWDESLIMKKPDGSLSRGGHWAGGMAYLTCSQQALELAKRAQNLPDIKRLINPNSYFIDTTYAAGLQECFDLNHPLSRADDMKWKQALSDYARDVFGVFGSECGREWAIPHSDFFEGLTGVSGKAYHDAGLLNKLGGRVVPLFEMVYRDCIAAYGKYGYDPAEAAEYVLQHISLGRPLNYHDIPPHLYWKQKAPAENNSLPAVFTRGQGGWTEGMHPLDRFVKNTAEILSPLYESTAEMLVTEHKFLTSDGKVQKTVFGSGSGATVVIVNATSAAFPYGESPRLGPVVLSPNGFLIDGPGFVAFHALEFAGVHYRTSTLFTLRTTDHKPFRVAQQVRIYHGFGEPHVRWDGRMRVVEKEADLALAAP